MAHELTDFLIALADRPWDVHQPRLDRALAESSLSEAQRLAVRSRRLGEILRLAAQEAETAAPARPAAAQRPRQPGAERTTGQLVVVGTGIKGVNELGREATAAIRDADKVLFMVAEPATRRLIRQLNATAEDLAPLYDPSRPRLATYQEMSERILGHVRGGQRVCAVFYGHPGVFVKPSHTAIRTARKEGHQAYMLPAVSALDCLFADFNIDPSTDSCQIFGATDLLVRSRRVDPTATVIIYQAACVGDPGYHGGTFDGRHVPILSEYLQKFYRPEHALFIYEASQVAVCNARIEKTTVSGLPSRRLTGASTLYLPPQQRTALDREMMARLGLTARQPAPLPR